MNTPKLMSRAEFVIDTINIISTVGSYALISFFKTWKYIQKVWWIFLALIQQCNLKTTISYIGVMLSSFFSTVLLCQIWILFIRPAPAQFSVT